MVVIAGALTAGATKAAFADQNAITGVSVSTGNADLKITQIIMHQWFDNPVSYTGAWTTYASGLWSQQQWFPGLSVNDGFYLGNYSTAHVGLTPTLSLVNYTESKEGMDDAFQLRVYGTGFDSGYQDISWWKANSFTLPNIAWVDSGAYGTHGTYAGTMTLKMKSDADNSVAGGTFSFDLHFDAAQTP